MSMIPQALELGECFKGDSFRRVSAEMDPTPRCSTLMAEIVFELRFAFVQCLQTQLPAMQLDCELVDVTGDFGALRLVLFQLSTKLVRVGERARIRFGRLWNGRLLSAF